MVAAWVGRVSSRRLPLLGLRRFFGGSGGAWALALALGGCMPFVVPPTRLSVGAESRFAKERGGEQREFVESGAVLRAGVHPLDVVPDGAGKVLDVGVGFTTEAFPAKDTPNAYGPYVEVGAYKTLVRWDTAQLRSGGFVSLEALWLGSQPNAGVGAMVGGLLEIGGQVTGPFADSDDDPGFVAGVAEGRWALGLFASASARQFETERQLAVAGGVSLRIPFAAGVACCAWNAETSGSSSVSVTDHDHHHHEKPVRRTPARPRRRD